MIKGLRSILGARSPLRLLWHRAKAFVAALRYGFPARRLAVIGITGTDGKTTTVGMVAHILASVGIRTGALSTAFFQIGDDVTFNTTQKTSPSPFMIQRFLRELVRCGCTHAVLECSSHGLVQGRLDWTRPSVAAITNIAMEHLDYHGSMDQYLKDKSILFRMLRKNGSKVLHYNDDSYRLLSQMPPHFNAFVYNEKITDIDEQRFGPSIHLWMEDIRDQADGPSATLVWSSKEPPMLQRSTLELSIPGRFNLSNALCAISCAKSIVPALPMEGILRALTSFRGVPGRLERIDEGQNFSVYIDFTVTPQSYEKTLTTLRSILPMGKRLLVLTGSCGDRMREKRPIIGRLCSELADVVCVTNEDPYTEDPAKIIDDVLSGVDRTRCEAMKIPDRMEAIKTLFAKAAAGDTVILCGKGSDTTMWTKDGQIPWNEREIARELLLSMKSPAPIGTGDRVT